MCSAFKNSLQELVLKLQLTQPSFVRCIAPNGTSTPSNYVEEHVQRQLRYTGVMETVRIRRQGFAVRMMHREFVERYFFLHYSIKEEPPEDKSAACRFILSHSDSSGEEWKVYPLQPLFCLFFYVFCLSHSLHSVRLARTKCSSSTPLLIASCISSNTSTRMCCAVLRVHFPALCSHISL